MVLQVICWSALAVLYFPGHYNIDTFYTLLSIIKNTPVIQQGLLFPAVISCLYNLDNSTTLICFLNIALFIFLLFKILRIFKIRQAVPLTVFFIMTFQPGVQCFLLHVGRDLFQGLVLALFVIIFAEAYFKKEKIGAEFWLKVMLCLIVLSESRQEGKIYYIVTAALFYPLIRSNQVSKTATAVFLTSLTIMTLAISYSCYQGDVFPADVGYQYTALPQQLNYIVKNRPDALTEQNKAALGEFIDYSVLSRDYAPNDPRGLFKAMSFKNKNDSEKWKNFLKATFNIYYENSDLYFKERFLMFAHTIGILNSPYCSNDFFESTGQVEQFVKRVLRLGRSETFKGIRAAHEKFLYDINTWASENFLVRFFLTSPLALMLFAVVMVFRNRKLWLFGASTLIFLIPRSIILYLCIQLPVAKYFTPLTFVPLILILMAFSFESETKTVDL
ncbi:MAG: DUF6020 family protein [Pseudobdellovibrio sp.]